MSVISKKKKDPESGLLTSRKPFVLNDMAERVGFEFTRKRSFNNIERTAGTVEQWKTIVSSANGSQTDHGLSVADDAGAMSLLVSAHVWAKMLSNG